MLSTIKIVVSLLTVFYGVGPLVADFNETHLLNPLWTPHARLHGLWYLMFALGVAGTGLYLVWFRNELVLPITLGLLFMSGFWIALIFSMFYGGAVSDSNVEVVLIAGLEANSFMFGVATLMFAACLILTLRLRGKVDT